MASSNPKVAQAAEQAQRPDPNEWTSDQGLVAREELAGLMHMVQS
jgi:hypothetical protein